MSFDWDRVLWALLESSDKEAVPGMYRLFEDLQRGNESVGDGKSYRSFLGVFRTVVAMSSTVGVLGGEGNNDLASEVQRMFPKISPEGALVAVVHAVGLLKSACEQMQTSSAGLPAVDPEARESIASLAAVGRPRLYRAVRGPASVIPSNPGRS